MTEDYLSQECDKIFKINLTNGSCEVIKSDEKITCAGIEQLFIQFANSERLFPEDRERFLTFANIYNFQQELSNKHRIKCFYRRICGTGYFWYQMLLVKASSNIIYLYTRMVDESVKMVNRLQGASNLLTLEDLRDRCEKESAYGTSIGLLMIDFSKENESDEILNYLYPLSNIYKYDDNCTIISFFGRSHSDFYLELAKAYRELANYNVEIGHTWRPENWTFEDLGEDIKTNLQINRKGELL